MGGNNDFLGRRQFIAGAGIAALAVSSSASARQKDEGKKSSSGKTRVVLVGTGIRGVSLWGKTLAESFSDVIEFVGLCDINPLRVEFAKKYIGVNCPVFTDFDKMLDETNPDKVIVTTIDSFHAKYICRAMEKGYDVITEKPIATDEKMCQEILEMERKTGRKLTVTFSYRYSPEAVRIKEIIASGDIGHITSVDFHYYLDTDHGASYFRRWHAYKQFNGTLLVAKSTHHFDLINWWMDTEPSEVFAYGELRKYGHNGLFRGERCSNCARKNDCEFYWDITGNEFLMDLYVKAESFDGYIRDACLYRENINTYDTMAVQARYNNGVMMSYSLNALMPYEGYFLSFNGTKGRLDVRVFHNQPWKTDNLAEFRITPLFKDSRTFVIPKVSGNDHWGADEKMQDMIFRKNIPDPLRQKAGSRDGVLSAMIGIAARRSIEQMRPFKIEELIKI